MSQKWLFLVAILCFAGTCLGQDADSSAASRQDLSTINGTHEPPMLGIGTQWKIQGEWSNNAYNTGTGYPNSSGQKGCLDGH